MCGISGIMHKHAGASGLAPIGEELVRMLDAMKHRGIDSTGITVAGEDSSSDLIVRIWADPLEDYRGLVQGCRGGGGCEGRGGEEPAVYG